MANPEHTQLVHDGVEAVNHWKKVSSAKKLDLSNTNFSSLKLDNVNFSTSDLSNCNFDNCSLNNANFQQANLSNSTFTNCTMNNSRLSQTDLQNTDFTNADCNNSNFVYAFISGAIFHKSNLTYCDFSNSSLKETSDDDNNMIPADFSFASMSHSRFLSAKLQYCRFIHCDAQHSNFDGCDLSGSDLAHADFEFATLTGVIFNKCNILQAKFKESRVHGANFTHVINAASAKNLDAVYVGTEFNHEARYFNTCIRDWSDTYLDWEQIRTVGRLPLFGASYTVLILIPLFFYAMSIYNDKVQLFVEWSNSNTDSADSHIASAATIIASKLSPLEIPNQSLLLLVATIFLAIGATIYTFGCPARVKEFSKDQWCDQLGKSLIHYWPLSWRNRRLRLTCAVCYFIGGTGVAWVLVTKIWTVFIFIMKNM